MKDLVFRGRSNADLLSFPPAVVREFGHQLFLVQCGDDPDDWKPMNSIGPGAREIRLRDESGAYRVVYLAKLADAVYVLHCFQKKTEKTELADVELARQRYRDLLQETRK